MRDGSEDPAPVQIASQTCGLWRIDGSLNGVLTLHR